MFLNGFYINLDRSAERRQFLNDQLHTLGLESRIQRFAAVDGATGPFDTRLANAIWACRRSHECVIAQPDADTATIVLEDDCELSTHFPKILTEDTVRWFVESEPTVDIVWLDCAAYWSKAPLLLDWMERVMSPPESGLVRPHLQTLGIVDARGCYSYAAAAYIVTPAGKRTLARLFDSARVSPAIPIDTLYNHWIYTGELNAKIFVPFLATPRVAVRSTIDHDVSEVDDMDEIGWGSVLRRALYADSSNEEFSGLDPMASLPPKSIQYELGMRMYDRFRWRD
ncbi:Glycosyltransferase family 25 (LPS biosynthesis protein) [Caballeronia arvi]|uniref:Glycosyltransferase family 25 (LPS biosynthesis protein) n=1 Tax=Caballeronia arvi TaxID=1777135 RepID=A0A158EPZ9_9BURK|nr:hypothetical protein [Caballeronia arvi]SAL09638.1 Glycosyltransferase family 25 (LPS biosynthesis protein) [Caballeronia arvi]